MLHTVAPSQLTSISTSRLLQNALGIAEDFEVMRGFTVVYLVPICQRHGLSPLVGRRHSNAAQRDEQWFHKQWNVMAEA